MKWVWDWLFWWINFVKTWKEGLCPFWSCSLLLTLIYLWTPCKVWGMEYFFYSESAPSWLCNSRHCHGTREVDTVIMLQYLTNTWYFRERSFMPLLYHLSKTNLRCNRGNYLQAVMHQIKWKVKSKTSLDCSYENITAPVWFQWWLCFIWNSNSWTECSVELTDPAICPPFSKIP